MRIGFVTQLLWERYGPFWLRLVAATGAEIVLPDRELVSERLASDPVVANLPVAAFKLAVAQAHALPDCDALVVPQLNPETQSERGGALDRWIADFPGALRDTGGSLPELIAVPAEVGDGTEGVAALVLSRILRDPSAVERVWSRHRAQAGGAGWRAAGSRSPSARPGSGRKVGVIAQPWLLNDALLSAVAAPGEEGVDARGLRPERLREVGRRFEERIIDSDAEVIGAARLLGSRSDVGRLVQVVDPNASSDGWLAKRVRVHSLKPVVEVALDDVLDDATRLDALLNLPVE